MVEKGEKSRGATKEDFFERFGVTLGYFLRCYLVEVGGGLSARQAPLKRE